MKVPAKFLIFFTAQIMPFLVVESCSSKTGIDIQKMLCSLKSNTAKSIQNISQTGALKTVLFPRFREESSKIFKMSQISNKSENISRGDKELVVPILLILFAPYIGAVVDGVYREIGDIHAKLRKKYQKRLNFDLQTILFNRLYEFNHMMTIATNSTLVLVQSFTNISKKVLLCLKDSISEVRSYALGGIQSLCLQSIASSVALAVNFIITTCARNCAKYGKACCDSIWSFSKISYSQIAKCNKFIAFVVANSLMKSYDVASLVLRCSTNGCYVLHRILLSECASGLCWVYEKLMTIGVFFGSLVMNLATWSSISIGSSVQEILDFYLYCLYSCFDFGVFVIDQMPEWIEDFVNLIPFLEFTNEGRVVLTNWSQEVLYILSIIFSTKSHVSPNKSV